MRSPWIALGFIAGYASLVLATDFAWSGLIRCESNPDPIDLESATRAAESLDYRASQEFNALPAHPIHAVETTTGEQPADTAMRPGEPPAPEEPPAPAGTSEGPGYDADTPTIPHNTPAPPRKVPTQRMGEPKDARRLSPDDAVWIHPKRGVVIVDGHVTLREGMLEMFACPRGTKEHESIVAVDSKAFIIHAALLNVGANPGHPAQFHPEYRPATGTVIDIQVLWIDADGKQRTARAQEWVRNVKTKKELAHPWVFAGSRFWTNPENNRKYYQAESGDLICVSNFSSAMLDLPIESSQGNEELVFEAFTKRIPPLGTPIRLILTPQLKTPSRK